MIPTNADIIGLLRQLEALLAEHTHLSVDDPLVTGKSIKVLTLSEGESWYNRDNENARHDASTSAGTSSSWRASMSQYTPDSIVIPLTKGYSTIVDAVDADLADFKWCVKVCVDKHRTRVYARRRLSSAPRNIQINLHRVIASRIAGRDLAQGDYVDHINGDGLDNRRANLRLTTPLGNAQNARIRADNTVGYKGITHDKKKNRWVARIQVDGKRICLGYHRTPESAYQAYCEAAERYHGEFANDGKRPA